MKKILYITYDGISDPLGMSQVLSYIKLFNKKKYQFFIFSFEKKVKISRYNEIIKNRDFSNIEFGFTYFRYGFLYKVLSIFFAVIRLARVIFNNKIDIIHCRGFIAALLGMLINFFCKKKIIYDYRSFPVLEWQEINKIRSKFFINVLKFIDNFIIKRSSHINILTNHAKKYFINVNHKATFSVIPTCSSINTSFQVPSLVKNFKKKISLVYVGGVRNPYKLCDILKLFKKISLIYKNTQLTIINENDHDLIKAEINDLKNKNKIIIKKINNEDLDKELFKYDFGLLFLEITKSREMCCPTKVGEYLACGLGLISCNGIKIIDSDLKRYKNINVISDINNTNEIKNLLNKIIYAKNNINFKKSSINIAKKHFNLFKGVKSYENIYNKLTI